MGFKRVNGKLVQAVKKPQIMMKDGKRMAVLRPITPEAAKRALDEAKAMAAEGSDDEARFNRIVSDQEKMIFAGLASTKGRLLDPQTLEDIGPMEPGDSFIDYDDLSKFQKVPQN